ncbi:MAG: GNAT family N-acetyltransferase [Bacilli bacterium]|nr:GNAT family N-acetyltransferase [Bacilli bacterium]
MQFEKSCGAVVYHYDQDECKILLIKQLHGRHWSFPKGHMEQNESEEETAVREVKEESGMDIQLIEGFREVNTYPISRNKLKDVIYFLGRAISKQVCKQEEEIEAIGWFTVLEAYEKITFENDVEILRKAMNFFEVNNNLILRQANLEDAEALGRMHYESWIHSFKDLVPTSYLDRLQVEVFIERFPKMKQVDLLEQYGKVIGFVSYGPSRDEDLFDYGEVYAIYLAWEEQGKGYGKRLMEQAKNSLLVQGYRNILLWTLENNQYGIRFYRKNGFDWDGKTKIMNFDEPRTCRRYIWRG